MENQKKEDSKKTNAVVIALAVLGVIIIIGQGRLSSYIAQQRASGVDVGNALGNLNGVIAQILVLVNSVMVLISGKKGFIASVAVNLFGIFFLIMGSVMRNATMSIAGISVYLVTMVTMGIIYFYSNKVAKVNQELTKSNQHLIETNRVIREKDEKLTYLAYYDVLTGLANRQLFLDHLDEIIEEDRNSPFTVIYFDIDNFKQVNDSYGHNIGDVILSTYADRLRLFCGESDFVGRLGGDEFAIIVKGNNSEATVVEYIQKLCSSICEPVNANGHMLKTTMSFGVASYPANGSGSGDILKCTDIAVYSAKASGKDRTCFYNPQSSVQLKF